MKKFPLIIIGVAIAIGVGIGLALSTDKQNPNEQYPKVLVSGFVDTVGYGTSPNRVDFKSGGQTQSASIKSDGTYQIELENRRNYDVKVFWSGAGGLGSGDCGGGKMNLNVNDVKFDYPIRC